MSLRIAESTRSIRLGDRELTYVLRRSNRRRSIGLIVNHQGLKVASPWQVPLAEIYALIVRSQDWVFDKLDAWQAERPEARRWISGETLYLLDREIRLEIEPAPFRHGVFLSGDRLRVYAPGEDSVARMVIAWYRSEAKSDFAERVARIAPRLQVQPRRLIISNAKHQWGSCNTQGSVRLNWRLMQASPAVVDYVVAHELAHLRHMDHSPNFWATVASVCPQYRQLRAQLKEQDAVYRSL